MVRKSLPVALSPVALLAILLSAATPERAEAQRTADGILVLSNAQWDSVRVELRVGASTDCAANPPLVVRVLRRNDRWAVVAPGDVICWRLGQASGDAATAWSTWGQARVGSDSVRNVAL